MEAARELLYDYNQEALNNFMSKIENVLIIELFLNEQNQYFMNKSEEAAKEVQQPQSKRKKKQLDKN